MEIDVTKFIAELAESTKENYFYIKENAENEKMYEVTQLINSLYFLIVVPEELFGINANSKDNTKFSVNEIKIKQLDKYPEIYKEINNLAQKKRIYYNPKCRFLKDSPVITFFAELRNALCHDGLGFLPIQTDYKGEHQNKITDIVFQTKDNDGNVRFITVVDIETMEKLMLGISDLYVILERKNKNKSSYKNYFSEIQKNAEKYLGECVK